MNRLSIAPDKDSSKQTFRVTHPFHPLYGREFKLVTYRNNWGEKQVYFHLEQEDLCSIPASFTDIGPQDPFVVFSQGRSRFRVEDLIKLANLIQSLNSDGRRDK